MEAQSAVQTNGDTGVKLDLGGGMRLEVTRYAHPTNGGYVGQIVLPGSRTVFIGESGDLSFSDAGTNTNTSLAPELPA